MEMVEDVEKGLREIEVRRWRQKAVDGKELVSVIKQAKGYQMAVGPTSE